VRHVARIAAVLVSLAAGAGAPAALAAAPAQIGTNGDRPVIAVDSAGVGHIAWEDRATGGVRSCTVPAGAATCTAALLPAPQLQAGGVGTLNIFAPTPSHIVIYGDATSCNGEASPLYSLIEYESTDGGASFTKTCRTPTAGAGVTPTGGKNVLDSAGRFISGGGAASGLYVLGVDPTGDIADNQQAPAHQIFATENFYDVATAIGGSGASSYLVAAAYSLDGTQPGIVYSVFNQAPDTSSTADLGDATKWTTGISLPNTAKTIDPPNLVSGPSGLFIVYQDQSVVGNERIGVNKFDPATRRFGPEVRVAAGPGETNQTLEDAYEDASGRIHVVWNSSAGTDSAVSTDGGRSFQVLGIVTTDSPIARDVAAGPDGRGWVVYIGEPPGNAVLLAPLPVPPKNTTVQAPGASITFGVPQGCVQPNATFKVTLSFKRKKKKGNLFVKVNRTDFYIGSKVVKVDTAAPFVQTLKVTASAKRGSTIALRARAYIKVTHGKVPKKSIRSSIKVCA